MKIYKDLEQGSQEWFDVRCGKLTASKASTIQANGKGLETLCFIKASEIVTGKMEEGYSNSAMKRGVELEPEARNFYEIVTGNSVEQIGFAEIDDRTGASPDGAVGKDGLVEIKCPSNDTFLRYMYDQKVDMKYYYQMQMQMWVLNRKWCDYVIYNPDFKKRMFYVRIKRNDKDIQKIKDGVKTGKRIIKEILKKVM